MEPTATVDELYEQHVRDLTPQQKRPLTEKIARELEASAKTTPDNSLLSLIGLGAEIWQQVDAQRYVNELRTEWDQ